MTIRGNDMAQQRVIFLIDEFGFPNGSASSSRVGLLGRAMVEAGLKVTVLATRPSEAGHSLNQQARGIYCNVEFEYTSGTTVRSRWFCVRRVRDALGWIVAMWRLSCAGLCRSNCTCIYLFSDSPSLCIPAAVLSRALDMPVIIELCEWHPALPHCSRSVRWYYRHLRFCLADGVTAISKVLGDRARATRPADSLTVVEVPILADLSEARTSLGERPDGDAYVLWCGNVDGYIESVTWLVRAFATGHQQYPGCRLVIVGGISLQGAERILAVADQAGLRREQVELTGYVPRQRLLDLYVGASALLAPLEDDDRSRSRFPTKIGEYLASGRPVITAGVGEILRFFRDGQNAYIYDPAVPTSFAACVRHVLADPIEAARVGEAGRVTAEKAFHYSLYGPLMKDFVTRLLA